MVRIGFLACKRINEMRAIEPLGGRPEGNVDGRGKTHDSINGSIKVVEPGEPVGEWNTSESVDLPLTTTSKWQVTLLPELSVAT